MLTYLYTCVPHTHLTVIIKQYWLKNKHLTRNLLAVCTKRVLITFIKEELNRRQTSVGFTQNCQSHFQSVKNCLGVGENSGGHRGVV